MRLEQLQYFIEIAHSHSISIAAENLYISQPALSRTVQSLEKELGIDLLVRTAGGVQLTQIGQMLLPQMQEVLSQTQLLYKNVAEYQERFLKKEPDNITLTIAALPCLVDSILPISLEYFSGHYPSIQINTQLLDLSDPLSLPTDSTVDLILSMNLNNFLDQAINFSSFYMEPLFIDNLSIVVSSGHELALRSFIYLNELLHHQIIVHDNGSCPNDFYNSFLSSADKLKIILRSNNPRAIIQLLLTQNTLLITNNLLIKNDYTGNPNLKIIPIKNLKSVCVALYNPDHQYRQIIEQFLETLKQMRAKI